MGDSYNTINNKKDKYHYNENLGKKSVDMDGRKYV